MVSLFSSAVFFMTLCFLCMLALLKATFIPYLLGCTDEHFHGDYFELSVKWIMDPVCSVNGFQLCSSSLWLFFFFLPSLPLYVGVYTLGEAGSSPTLASHEKNSSGFIRPEILGVSANLPFSVRSRLLCSLLSRR